MEMTNNYRIVLGVAVFLILTVVLVYGRTEDGSSRNVIENKNSTQNNATTPDGLTGNQELEDNLYTFEIIDVTKQIPNLDREIVITTKLSESIKEDAINGIRDSIVVLKKNPSDFDAWINLSNMRKLIGDYEGSKEALEYLGAIYPENTLSFSNLANLYGYYLQDNGLAEKNYLIAINNGSTDIFHYSRAFDFYIEIVKDERKAIDIYERAIRNIPGMESEIREVLDNL